MNKTALVTGATGFVGSNVTKRLVENGWRVHVILRPQSKLTLLDNLKNNVTFHYHDGSAENMLGILKSIKPDIVFHLASLFLAHHQTKHIEEMIKSNITFGTQLVDAMTAIGSSCMINTGTSWQHFQNKKYNPVCLYAATKQAFESILTFYTQTTLLKVITLKLFDTFGPNDPRPKLFTLLRKTANENNTLAMSPGEQLIDLVYIDDVVDAFMKAAERFQKGKSNQWEEYAVSSGNPIPLKEIVSIYGSVTGKRLSINWGERLYRHNEVMIPWNKGKCLPGWETKISLEEGIKRMELGSED
ncbi:NAD(P)-dependent oxidoreductase [Metabacillus sp. KUDC1714]|uniref:NAD(P)-dependent oxidoreductase n=1 Tax=Metabacillus elymi TaxID=2745198 RepID=A0ABX6SC70_9BACI|nr:NAD(P)-dependent oxidoreductase [Metabacillus sp. KUDC1714]